MQTKVKIYRNWPAICKIADTRQKLLVSICKDEALLSRLTREFPEYFLEEKPEHPGPFPLSVLREITYERDANIHTPSDAMQIVVGFPFVVFGGDQTDIPITKDLRSRLGEAEALYKMLPDVEANSLFPYHLFDVVAEGVRYYVGWMPFGDPTVGYELHPADLVDVNA